MTGSHAVSETTYARLRRPAWRSPRVGIGLLLVLASVALGAWTIGTATRGDEVWVAATDLAPGDPVTTAELRIGSLRWDGADGTYLSAAVEIPEGAVATDFVGAGHLVPASALGSADEIDVRPMAVPLPLGVEAGAGSLVDVWAVPARTADGDQAPWLVAESVLVAGVAADTGLFGSGSGQVARVLIPAELVSPMLAVQAAGGEVTLVERPGA